MRRLWIGFLAAASAVCFWMLAKTGTDAAKLLPARVLVIEERDGAVRVSSDNGAAGSGETLAAALQQMERSAGGVLFLDTAEHIVLLRPTQALLEQALALCADDEKLEAKCRPVLQKNLEDIQAQQAMQTWDACAAGKLTSFGTMRGAGDPDKIGRAHV